MWLYVTTFWFQVHCNCENDVRRVVVLNCSFHAKISSTYDRVHRLGLEKAVQAKLLSAFFQLMPIFAKLLIIKIFECRNIVLTLRIWPSTSAYLHSGNNNISMVEWRNKPQNQGSWSNCRRRRIYGTLRLTQLLAKHHTHNFWFRWQFLIFNYKNHKRPKLHCTLSACVYSHNVCEQHNKLTSNSCKCNYQV